MKSVVVYLFACLCLLLNACEYETGENFIDVKKPVDKPVQMQIELSLDNVGEQLYLYEPVPISYYIQVADQPFLKCRFTIGKYEWESENPRGSFFFEGESIQNGDYTLTCEIYTRTGSGSIADQIGGEAYLGTYTWPVHVALYERPDQSFIGYLNPDGYLEFVWKKPVIGTEMFDCYKLIDDYGNETIIRDLNQESYVCKTYVGQIEKYSLKACFKDPLRVPWDLGIAHMDAQDVHFAVDFPTVDSMRISWNNPYKSVARIRYNNKWIEEEWSKTSITVPYFSFGGQVDAEIVFLPFDKADRTDRSAYYASLESRLLKMGVLVYPGGNAPRYGYNPAEDALYVSSYNEVTSWDLPACIKNSLFASPQYDNVSEYAIVHKSPLMAVQHNTGIEILGGKKMADWKMVTVAEPYSFTETPTLTDDGKLIAFVSSLRTLNGVVYNAETGEKEKEFAFPEEVPRLNKSLATPDGRYLYYEFMGELYVGNLFGYRNNLLHKFTQPFTSWYVDPSHSERLFVATEAGIEMYDCSVGFSVARTFRYPGMDICNVDPKTGNLLLASFEQLLVIDPESGKELLAIQKSMGSRVLLLGNCLCADDSAVLSIDKYMNK